MLNAISALRASIFRTNRIATGDTASGFRGYNQTMASEAIPHWSSDDVVHVETAQRIARKLDLDFEMFLHDQELGDPGAVETIPVGTLVAWLKANVKPQK